MGNRKTNRANRIRIRSRVSFAVCWMIVCISLTLTACGKDKGISKNNLSEEGNAAGIAQEREWVYVPEVITVGDEHADYGRMQLVGDTFCYALQSGETDSSAIFCSQATLMGLPPYRSIRRGHGSLSKNFWRRKKANLITEIFLHAAFRP